MKNITIKTLFLLSTILTGNALAHDPSMHQPQPAEKPKCEKMKDMDHSNMNMDDPVMQAMMKKCMSKDSAEGEGVSEELDEAAAKHD